MGGLPLSKFKMTRNDVTEATVPRHEDSQGDGTPDATVTPQTVLALETHVGSVGREPVSHPLTRLAQNGPQPELRGWHRAGREVRHRERRPRAAPTVLWGGDELVGDPSQTAPPCSLLPHADTKLLTADGNAWKKAQWGHVPS